MTETWPQKTQARLMQGGGEIVQGRKMEREREREREREGERGKEMHIYTS